MTDDDTQFPSTTFAGKFNGAGAISANFDGEIKFKVLNIENVLAEIHGLPGGDFDITLASRQLKLAGDSTDREWADMDVQADPEELQYAAFCLGSVCPVFTVHTSGDLEGKYVCEHDSDVPMEVKQGSTHCPRYPQETLELEDPGEAALENDTPAGSEDGFIEEPPAPDFTEEDEAEAEPQMEKVEELTALEVDELPDETPFVMVKYPDAEEAVKTYIGDKTQYGEFVADYLTEYGQNHTDQLDYKDFVVMDDEGDTRHLKAKVQKRDRGATLYVESLVVGDQ